MQLVCIGMVAVVLGFGLTAHAAELSAKKDGVAILAQAKRDAAVLKELKQGESVEASDREGMYWKVTLPNGTQGFVSALQMERKAQEDSSIQSELRKSALAARSSADEGSAARARSSVMGVRGLDESKDLSQAGNLRPDYRSVYSMEDRSVPPSRIQKLGLEIQGEIEKSIQSKPPKE
jgi:hypothetical protein